MKFVQILYNKAHWIFEANVKPDFPPDPEGNPIILVDITGRMDITEGMDYDAETGIFTEPVIEIPEYEPELIPPTEQEIFQAEMMLGQAELYERFDTVEAGNAAILLMLAEGGKSDVRTD